MYTPTGRFVTSSHPCRASYLATPWWCPLHRDSTAAVAAAADRVLLLLPLPLVGMRSAAPPDPTSGARCFKKSPGSYLLAQMMYVCMSEEETKDFFGYKREATPVTVLLASIAQTMKEGAKDTGHARCSARSLTCQWSLAVDVDMHIYIYIYN